METIYKRTKKQKYYIKIYDGKFIRKCASKDF